MIAVIPVRDGLPAVGAQEAAAEAGGRCLLIGSCVSDAVSKLPADTIDITLVEAGGYRPGAWAVGLAAFLDPNEIVIIPASADGRDLAPRLAVKMGRHFVAGALRIADDHLVIPFGGHRAQTRVAVAEHLVATIEPGCRFSFPAPPENPSIRELEIEMPNAHDAEIIEVLPADPATIDLEEAGRVVAGGIGLADEEHFLTMCRVAAKLGASVGATRLVVDAGWTEFARQIGTTGAMIDPDLYVAVAISGAVQHTSGLGNPAHIVSINTDRSCPMMQLADLAVVADGPAVLAELDRLLNEEAVDGD